MSTYIAIDLKSFYASVECVEHGFDPLKTNLVVADEKRSEKTICLAVSPSLKECGVSGRPRLFEVVQTVKDINKQRLLEAPGRRFVGDSIYSDEIKNNPGLALNYFVAKPRMSYYMKYSTKIYNIYLKYVSKDDIHVYSIDEVFIDVTNYLKTYKLTAHDLAMKMIQDVLKTTGITATCGIGPNLYLAKVAMDIVAKHIKADSDGVRIAQIDIESYRKLLWEHQPLTDFWRIGKGISNKLMANGMFCQGDIALMSLKNEDLLYELFGVNAELIIDHAWGEETVTIKDIKKYKPENKSLSSGQVLKEPYTFNKAKIIVKEMVEALVLDLVDKKLVADQMVLTIIYDTSNQSADELVLDYYGRLMPKQAHGSINIGSFSNSRSQILDCVLSLYEQIVNRRFTIRKIYVVANHVVKEDTVKEKEKVEQLDLFLDYQKIDSDRKENKEKLKKERNMQEAILKIQKKYGKNSIVKGNSLQEGATALERNQMVGGHKA